MKHLKLFENYTNIQEIEDYLLDLIDTGLVERLENGKFFNVTLKNDGSVRKAIPTHYCIKFRIIQRTITSIEDVISFKNLYQTIENIFTHLDQSFEMTGSELTIFIKLSDSIENFFAKWATTPPHPKFPVGSCLVEYDYIKVKSTGFKKPADYMGSDYVVYEIGDDFSITFFRWIMKKKTKQEILDAINAKIQSGVGYKAEVSVKVSGENESGHFIYIKVYP